MRRERPRFDPLRWLPLVAFFLLCVAGAGPLAATPILVVRAAPDGGIARLIVASPAATRPIPRETAAAAGLPGLAVGDGLHLVGPPPRRASDSREGGWLPDPVYSVAEPRSGLRMALPAGLSRTGVELVAFGNSPEAITVSLPARARPAGLAGPLPARVRFVGYPSAERLAELQLILDSGLPPRTGPGAGPYATKSGGRDQGKLRGTLLTALIGAGLIVFAGVRRRVLEPSRARAATPFSARGLAAKVRDQKG